MANLRTAAAKVDEEWKKQRYIKMAEVMKIDFETELKPNVIQQKWAMVEKGGSA